MSPGLDGEAQALLGQRQTELGQLMAELANSLWGRHDRAAITAIRYCIVDLPGTLLLKAHDLTDPVAVHALEHAVRGIASQPPPSHPGEQT